MDATHVVNLVLLFSFLGSALSFCPGPNGLASDGETWVNDHFVYRCTSGETEYRVQAIACATSKGTRIVWNQQLTEEGTRYDCMKDRERKSLRIRLSVGIQDLIFTAPETEIGQNISPTDALDRFCFIPGIGKIAQGQRVVKDYEVVRCDKNGIYKVVECILPEGERVGVGKSKVIGNHRWICRTRANGARAQISKIPVETENLPRNSGPECVLGEEKTVKSFRIRCITSEVSEQTVWSVTHCIMRGKPPKVIPLGGTYERGIFTYQCLELPNHRARIAVKSAKPEGSRGKSASVGLKSSSKGRPCPRPCKVNGRRICRGEDELVARNHAGDSRIRCTMDGVTEQYCRVRALFSDDFYELQFGTFTEVDGKILACAQFSDHSDFLPGNSAPASRTWISRLKREKYQYMPSETLRK